MPKKIEGLQAFADKLCVHIIHFWSTLVYNYFRPAYRNIRSGWARRTMWKSGLV